MVTSAFASDGSIGASLKSVWAASDDTPGAPFALGTQVTGSDGSVWVFVQFGTGGVTGTGYACVIDIDFGAVMLTTSNDTYGMNVGIPAFGAAIATDYGWLQRFGPCDAVQVAASAGANVDLVATATAGQLDDQVTTGVFVKGVVLTTARAASDGVAPAMLTWPVIDTLYEPET